MRPCKCTGSVGFLHFECLKDWLDMKVKKYDDGDMVMMSWKNFECELCKEAYPYRFKVDDNLYNLVNIVVPDALQRRHFLVIESLPLKGCSSRIIYLLSFTRTKKDYKIGKGNFMDLKVSERTLSEFHASLKCKSNEIFLKDHKSKYGTLVLIKNAFHMMKYHQQAF
jgi:hypothetical protein